MRRLTKRAVGLGIALLGCTGCSGVAGLIDSPGDLTLGGDSGVLCIRIDPRGEYTYAFDVVKNTTDEAITVNAVTLIGAKNAVAEGGYLAPIVNTTLIGAMPGWPPEGDPPAFDEKQPVPTDVTARQEANLVVHLVADGPADIDALEVTYTSNGDEKTVRNSTKLQIRDACF